MEDCIIQYWLKGETRDKIAEAFETSKGTVSNKIAKFRNKLGNYDVDALRELGKELRRHNMTADNCAIGFRLIKILEKLDIPEAKFEEFLTSIFEFSQKMDIYPEILRDALIEFAQLSQKMPLSQITSYLQEKRQEIKELENRNDKLKEDIEILENEKLATEEKTRDSLKDANTTLFNLDIFVKTKNKLAKFGIIVEDTEKFTRCVQGVKEYSNYDPFKVIEKFSDLNTLEIEIENNQKKENDLEKDILKLKEREFEYDDRLNLKSIKLKNLDELEKIGFTIQDLKKLNSILIEIISEHKNLNIEQIKPLFFELFEKIETRIALESENNAKMELNLILENQIKSKRQTLHCQEVVGPILKNLFDSGIGEIDIVAMKGISDLFLDYRGNDVKKLNIKPEVIMNIFSYSNNSRLEKEYLKLAFNFILNAANFGKPQLYR
jgi:hypothetical protein